MEEFQQFILKKIDSFVFILRVDQVRLGSPCPIEDGILAFGRRRLVQKSRAQQQGAGQQCGKTDRVEAVQHSPIRPDCSIAHTYFGTSVWTHAKQRIPWLLILMLSATFTGMVTTHYEEAFVSLPLLVSFMPMLMDTAGNCGNQISTLMVRGLALGEVEPADFMRVLAKELRVSAIVGAVLGVVNGLRIYLMYTFLFPGQYANVMGYAIVVSVSLFFSVILAKLVGGMLPLAAKKLGADPAIMATPFITTIVDACSLILYFQIAQLVFRNMM